MPQLQLFSVIYLERRSEKRKLSGADVDGKRADIKPAKEKEL